MDGQPSPRNYTRLAAAIVIVAILAAAIVILTTSTGTTTSRTSTTSPCSLLTQAQMEGYAWNGAGREIPGINQSAPPWNYQSIYDHIQEGWQTLCQTAAFVSAIQVHGARSFSSGGGFVNPSDPDNSQMGVTVGWTQTISTNCTQYMEEWSILIVNSTVIGPTTTSIPGCPSST